MNSLTTLAPTASTDEIMNVINRDGAVILRDMLTPEGLKRLKSELMPYIEATGKGKDEFFGHNTTRTCGLIARSAMCREMLVNKTLLSVCDQVLLPSCESYQILTTQAIRIKPGESVQHLHRDRWAWGRHLSKEIEPQLNCMWAVTDFTQENGATQVVPGSMDWPDDQLATEEQICYAEMKAGSVMVFNGSVFHGGGNNRSGGERIGVLLDYTLGWLRQEENQYLSCPPEIAKDFDPAVQKLLGYSLGSYGFGYYSPPLAPGEGPEGVSPEYALDPSVNATCFGDQAMMDLAETELRENA